MAPDQEAQNLNMADLNVSDAKATASKASDNRCPEESPAEI